MFSFEVNLLVDLGSGENIVTDGNVVDEDTFKFVCLGAKNFIFLECLQIIDREISNNCASFCDWLVFAFFDRKLTEGISGVLDTYFSGRCGLLGLLLSVNKFYRVGVDDAVTLTLNFKVVGNQVNRTALNERVW